MQQQRWLVILGVLLVASSNLQAAPPIVVTVQHDAVFDNLADYPQYEFYLAASSWNRLQQGTPTQINLPEWQGIPVYLYAIPRQEIEQRGGLPPDEWLTATPPSVMRTVEALAVRDEGFLDFDLIGQTPALGKPRGAVAMAGLWGPTEVEDPPPGALGPIVPYRYLMTYRVTMSDQLHLTVVSERAFDRRGNHIVRDGSGNYVLAPKEKAGKSVIILLVASTALIGIAVFLWRRYRASERQRAGSGRESPPSPPTDPDLPD